jgi:hypothetical protein
METSYVPTPQDVERYQSLRAAALPLNHEIVKTIPRQAYEEIGDAIGIRQNGLLVFDSEDMASVLMDCCLYDWFEGGKNVVQRYAESQPAQPGTDESYLLQAYLQAKYGILVVRSAISGAGLYCRDILHHQDLFLMDIALSQSIPNGQAVLATRTIPLGEYWITGGAALPITSKEVIRKVQEQTDAALSKTLKGASGLALPIVRACLAAGAAEHVAYGAPERSARRRTKIPPRLLRHR